MNKEHVWTFNKFHEQSVCETCNRIAAFGAIRRAAEVMRGLQEECGSGWCYYDESSCTCVHMEIYQRLMRRAIRAAIGSEKA